MTKICILLALFCSNNIWAAEFKVAAPLRVSGISEKNEECWIQINSVTNEDKFLPFREVDVQINHRPDDHWQLTHVTAEHPDTVEYFSRQLGGFLGNRVHSLLLNLDENGKPSSFFYWDNTGKEFKRRSFECRF
jgi:hypothetical protein